MQSVLGLTIEERRVLKSLTRSRVSPAADVKRARLIVMLDEGLSWQAISHQLPCSPDYINRWRRRFSADRLGGLYARHKVERRPTTKPRSRHGFLPGLRKDRPM